MVRGMVRRQGVLSFAIMFLRCVSALDNGVGVTPPMGWRRYARRMYCIFCIYCIIRVPILPFYSQYILRQLESIRPVYQPDAG